MTHRHCMNYPVTYINISSNEAAAENTLQVMKKVIQESGKNWKVRLKATRIVRNVKERDKKAEVEAIYNWVKNHTRFTRDIQGTELLHSPLVSLDLIERDDIALLDCDDMTVLSLSLLKSIGFPVALRATSYRNDKTLSHVYGLVNIKGIWTPIDCVKKDFQVGDEALQATRMIDIIA